MIPSNVTIAMLTFQAPLAKSTRKVGSGTKSVLISCLLGLPYCGTFISLLSCDLWLLGQLH